MIKPVSMGVNKRNLIEVSEILNKSEIDYSVFYGTALGIHREGDILSHDDDIDFIVNSIEIDKLANTFSNQNFTITVFVSNTFLQISRVIDGEQSFVDFYSYQEITTDILVDRWNFRGIISDSNTHLHIPRNLLLPTQKLEYGESFIKIPNNIDGVCSFLYGTRYREKLIKGVDYITQVNNNKPNITYIR
jgi:phosphorylcholine metabolism protein LicD